MESKLKDLELLFFLGHVKKIKRSWCVLGFDKAQNVAEHSYRVAFIAYILAKELNADIEKVLLMSLLHDVPEVLCGDANNIQISYTLREEDKAFWDIFSKRPDLISVWNEFIKGESLESKITKDADSLEALLEIKENYASNKELFDKFLLNKNEKLDNLFFTITKTWFTNLINNGTKPLDWMEKFI